MIGRAERQPDLDHRPRRATCPSGDRHERRPREARRHERRVDRRAHRHPRAPHRRRRRGADRHLRCPPRAARSRWRASTAASIDLLIVATVTPDMAFPSTRGAPRRRSSGCRTRPPTTSRPAARASSTRSRRRTAMLAAGLAKRALVVGARRALEDPRLDRPLDARALRRRRRRGRARSASSRAGSSASSSAPTARGGASLWLPGQRLAPVRGPREVREDERPRGLQVRDPRDGELGRGDPRRMRQDDRRRRRLRPPPGERPDHRSRCEEARRRPRRRPS